MLKILYLAISRMSTNRGGEIGTNTQGWKQALNALSIAYPNRLNFN